MASEGGGGASGGPPRRGFVPAREGIDPRNALRIALGLAAVALAVLAALALLESFVLEPAPDQGPQQGAPRESGGGRRGGADVDCGDVATFLKWTFFGLALASVTLLGVGFARRQRHGGDVAGTVWGVLSLLAFFFALVALGGWRVVNAFCEADVTCSRAANGTYSAFLVLLTVTAGSAGAGMAKAWRTRRGYFTTGWAVLATLAFLPTLLVGFAWYLVRLFCSPDLSCATRDEFLGVLARTFGYSVGGAVVAFAAGFWAHRRRKLGVFGSGWGVLGVKLLVLAALAGAGWLYVDGLYLPACDPPPEERTLEIRTCTEIRDDLRDRIATGLWVVGGALVLAAGSGVVVHRAALRRFWSSPFAIVAYVLLGALVMGFLLYLLVGSLCGEGEGDFPGDGGGTAGDGSQGGGGSGQGPGTGGGGSGSGSPGGAGGTGPQTPIDIQLDPRGFLGFVLALAAVLALLFLLTALGRRRGLLLAGDAPPPQEPVNAAEAQRLLRILDTRDLTTAEAIVAAYRAFLAWATGAGLAKGEEETPREHAERVLAAHPVAAESMERFVAAYEVARLSARDPTAAEREEAVAFSRRFVRPTVAAAPAETRAADAPTRRPPT